jgi:hypothetical protein
MSPGHTNTPTARIHPIHQPLHQPHHSCPTPPQLPNHGGCRRTKRQSSQAHGMSLCVLHALPQHAATRLYSRQHSCHEPCVYISATTAPPELMTAPGSACMPCRLPPQKKWRGWGDLGDMGMLPPSPGSGSSSTVRGTCRQGNTSAGGGKQHVHVTDNRPWLSLGQPTLRARNKGNSDMQVGPEHPAM